MYSISASATTRDHVIVYKLYCVLFVYLWSRYPQLVASESEAIIKLIFLADLKSVYFCSKALACRLATARSCTHNAGSRRVCLHTTSLVVDCASPLSNGCFVLAARGLSLGSICMYCVLRVLEFSIYFSHPTLSCLQRLRDLQSPYAFLAPNHYLLIGTDVGANVTGMNSRNGREFNASLDAGLTTTLHSL